MLARALGVVCVTRPHPFGALTELKGRARCTIFDYEATSEEGCAFGRGLEGRARSRSRATGAAPTWPPAAVLPSSPAIRRTWTLTQLRGASWLRQPVHQSGMRPRARALYSPAPVAVSADERSAYVASTGRFAGEGPWPSSRPTGALGR